MKTNKELEVLKEENESLKKELEQSQAGIDQALELIDKQNDVIKSCQNSYKEYTALLAVIDNALKNTKGLSVRESKLFSEMYKVIYKSEIIEEQKLINASNKKLS